MTQKERLTKCVVEYLDSQGLHYRPLGDDGNAFEFGMNIHGKLQSVREVVVAADTEIQAFAVSPISADEKARANVAEFITRVNYSMKIGKFEMDYDDGMVRYYCCLPCTEGEPSMSDVERVIDIPFIVMKRYGDGLVKNMMGFGNPKADIEEIEE